MDAAELGYQSRIGALHFADSVDVNATSPNSGALPQEETHEEHVWQEVKGN